MAQSVDTSKIGTQRQAIEFSVKGRSAIVTGAGSGIGLEFVKKLLSKGCNVLLADLALRPDAQTLLDTHSDTSSNGAPRAIFLKTDVTDWNQLSALFPAAYVHFGSLDIVCPCAGVFEPKFSSFWHPPGSSDSRDTDEASRYASIDINLTHPIRAAQLAISHFLSPPLGDAVSAANPKRVLLVSSIIAQAPALPYVLYCTAKAGISHFTRSLALLDDAHGIRVSAIAPGLADSPMVWNDPEIAAIVDRENDKLVRPERLAEVMLELLESPGMAAGSVIEVGTEHTRKVEVLDDSGPQQRPGTIAGNIKSAYERTMEKLAQPGWGR